VLAEPTPAAGVSASGPLPLGDFVLGGLAIFAFALAEALRPLPAGAGVLFLALPAAVVAGKLFAAPEFAAFRSVLATAACAFGLVAQLYPHMFHFDAQQDLCLW
jgi:hypothetical protein